ncbi:MAG: glycosyltransferase [Calditrichaceae bacterium]
MEIISIIILLILSTLLITLLFNSIFGPFLFTRFKNSKTPKVSLLIPARNEENNIKKCLEHLVKQDYKNFEIIVLDDNSQDGTSKAVQELQRQFSGIKLIQGQSLPNGWTGKNWACHQLGKAASGKVFIFTDADTIQDPTAVSRTLGWIQKYNLGMLSTFPQQHSKSFAEKLIVPIIDFFIYSMLPLWSTYYINSSVFAAANGQWIAIEKDVYDKIGGHESVKNEIVEDIKLNKLAKQFGIKTLTTAGTNIVYCNMYHSFREIWYGFSKNFYGLTGHSPFIFILIEFALLISCVLPFILLLFNFTSAILLIIIAMNLIIRAVLSIRYKHPFFISVFLHPVSILSTLIIGFNSFYQYYWGNFRWKDRIIQVKNIPTSRSLNAEK